MASINLRDIQSCWIYVVILSTFHGKTLLHLRTPSSYVTHFHVLPGVILLLNPVAVLKSAECEMAVCQNLVPLVNIKIAGKWMFIPLKMVLIGIDPYPNYAKKKCTTALHILYSPAAAQRALCHRWLCT